jgi:hypothetical protein
VRRVAFLALAAAVALSVVALTRGAGTVAPVEVAPAHDPVPSGGQPGSRSTPQAEPPLRNVFEYGAAREVRAGPAPTRFRASGPPAPPPSSEPDPVRWIGVVVQGDSLKAALAIDGEIVLLSPGQSGMGYTLLTVDRDEGATLRTPSGDAVRVPAGP